MDYVLNEVPWFWGRVGIFVTPWFPRLDGTSMVATKMLVWVRLHNIPLPFWHHQVLEGIGISMGIFLKMDKERMDKGIFTFAHICVETDLIKHLPDHIHLIQQEFKWTQWLDLKTLLSGAPSANRHGTCKIHVHKQKKGAKKRPQKTKGWKFPDLRLLDDEEEEKDESKKQP